MNIKEEFEKAVKSSIVLKCLDLTKDTYGNYTEPLTVTIYYSFVRGWEIGLTSVSVTVTP